MKAANGDSQRVEPAVIGVILVISVLSLAIIIFFATVSINFFSYDSGEYEYEDWSNAVSHAPQSLALQWAPDGSQILFTKPGDPKSSWAYDNLYSIAPDGTRLHKIVEGVRWPTISPDGSRIAHSTTRDRRRLPYYIETFKRNGSDRRRLIEQSLQDIPAGLNDISPAWSPDGQRIAFARFDPKMTEGRGIYVVDVDGSTLSQPYRFNTGRMGDTVTDVYRWGPSWSPNGKKLAFVVVEFQENVGPRDVLYTVNADGSKLTRVFATAPDPNVYSNTFLRIDEILGVPTWSPNSGELAFIRVMYPERSEIIYHEESHLEIILHVIDPNSSRIESVAKLDQLGYIHKGSLPNYFMSSLSWSPDGTNILFTVGGGVNVASADGSGYRQIAKGLYASWSPDGSRIAVMDRPSGNYISTISLDGSDVRVLVWKGEDGNLKVVNR